MAVPVCWERAQVCVSVLYSSLVQISRPGFSFPLSDVLSLSKSGENGGKEKNSLSSHVGFLTRVRVGEEEIDCYLMDAEWVEAYRGESNPNSQRDDPVRGRAVIILDISPIHINTGIIQLSVMMERNSSGSMAKKGQCHDVWDEMDANHAVWLLVQDSRSRFYGLVTRELAIVVGQNSRPRFYGLVTSELSMVMR
ncbi:hypothetical protein RRG08_054002 [Elysia crispata]|uniref:Uncharacterized protein n=1 Tax=Elysia crispata TaxID=231223 RepID=A0AAE0ZB84_9GAST|nr:hypothetical protein RRG08_054002 [Elysia crispata]